MDFYYALMIAYNAAVSKLGHYRPSARGLAEYRTTRSNLFSSMSGSWLRLLGYSLQKSDY